MTNLEYEFKTVLEKFIVYITLDRNKPLFLNTDEEISSICSKFEITLDKKSKKMLVIVKDNEFIDVSKINNLISKNEAKVIKLETFVDETMKRRLFIIEDGNISIPYRICPFEIYNEGIISYLRVLSNFYYEKVKVTINEFELNSKNIKIIKAEMDQNISKYIKNKIFLPGKRQFIESIRSKGFYVDWAAWFEEYFEIDRFCNIDLKVNYEWFAEVKQELENYAKSFK